MAILKYIVNDTFLLDEANIINAGKQDIEIKDADGNEVEIIYSFNKILSQYLNSTIFNQRTTPEVRRWFESNFTKWLKLGAPDHADDMMDEAKFREVFYVPLDTYINELLAYDQELVKNGKLSREIVLNSFPEFVRKNPHDAVIFSGGRKFRLKKVTPAVEKLHEFLVAVVQNGHDRNDTIMPPTFMVKRLDTLDVPNAFKRTVAWHEYTEQQAEKVSIEQAKQLVKSLKAGKDYKVLEKFPSGAMVQLLTANAAKAEGTIMKHCVASYGHDIEKGRATIYSFRDAKTFLPVATIEMRGSQAFQVKGPHNSTIKPQYHDDIREFFTEHGISVGADAKNFGGMKERTKKKK